MLEYNADTPSMIIESGYLQDDWFKVVGKSQGANVYQSNYVQESLRNSMNLVAQECRKPAFVHLAED